MPHIMNVCLNSFYSTKNLQSPIDTVETPHNAFKEIIYKGRWEWKNYRERRRRGMAEKNYQDRRYCVGDRDRTCEKQLQSGRVAERDSCSRTTVLSIVCHHLPDSPLCYIITCSSSCFYISAHCRKCPSYDLV